MNTFKKTTIALSILTASASAASAQYYQMVNQATDMLQTALTGGSNYRGYVDVSYLAGIGSQKANFLEFSTTQGIKYGDIFYMGVGAGVDVMFTKINPENTFTSQSNQTAVMIPLFTDFRLTFGQPTTTNFFIDLKVGAGFYVSDEYIYVGDGYLNSSSSFYLKPTVGIRIPVSKTDPKLAVNFGASYLLTTNSYWYDPGYHNDTTLSSLGLTASIEW